MKQFDHEKPEILSAHDIWHLCADIRDSKFEHFLVFYLDSQSKLIERQIINLGALEKSTIHPREVFEPALKLHATSLIIAHNYPSGSLEPSSVDRKITVNLINAGDMLGIEMEDYIVFSSEGFSSYRQQRFL